MPQLNRTWIGGTTFVGRPAGKQLLGMVHLPPLPGSPGAQGRPAAEVLANALEAARRDARRLLDGGMDGLIIENIGDAPFYPNSVPPATVASMAAIACQLAAELRVEFGGKDGAGPFLGVNVLRNDASAALAVAAAAHLDAIRVNIHTGVYATDQGLIEGEAHRTLRERQSLGAKIFILADLLVKHAAPLGHGALDPEVIARDAVHRGLADGLIITGKETGAAADLALLRKVRRAVPERAILVGSGITAKNIRKYLVHADGVIVGTALKEDSVLHAPVDPKRVRRLVREARQR
ncbi:MAG: BtpA/SgcQ family protein [Planctomycetes bacterium]|nr:BtpA/SgcQ family protein [Planctomycetota bacterium]